MPYLNLLATIHCPVSAVGNDIRNSFGVKVASCTDSWTATAIAALINHGVPGAQAEHGEHLAAEDRKVAMLKTIPALPGPRGPVKTALLAAAFIVTALPAFAYCGEFVAQHCNDAPAVPRGYYQQQPSYQPSYPQQRTVCQIEGGGFAPQRMVCHQEY